MTKIIQHVRDVDVSYLMRLGGKLKPRGEDTPGLALTDIRQAIFRKPHV